MRVRAILKLKALNGLALSLVLLGVLCACTVQNPQQSTQPTTEPTIASTPTITTVDQVVRPIDAYLRSNSDVLSMISVETRLVNACLTKNSLAATYTPAQDPAQLVAFIAGLAADNVIRNDLWGFFDTTSTVSTYGYSRPPSQPGVLLSQVPPGSSNILHTCQSEADQKLPGGSRAQTFGGLSSLPNRGPAVPSNDSRWIAAVLKWADCMKAAGFPDYRTPHDALADPQWYQKQGAAPTTRQIATASADISCKRSTNLVGIGLAIQSAYDHEYIQKNRDALDAYKKQLDDYLAQG